MARWVHGIGRLGAALVATALSAQLLAGTATAATAPADPTAPGRHQVTTAEYRIGDQAFEYPGYEGRSELAGIVHYPRDLGAGRYPLVVFQHGQWDTCADRVSELRFKIAVKLRDLAEAAGDTAERERQQQIVTKASYELRRWPCAPGIPQLPSYRGYDQLARQLASHGFVVVSVGANGINATSFGQAPTVYRARAALVNKHLELWQRLSATGTGDLAGAFRHPGTDRAKDVDFRGRVDLSRVGTLGHSMGGGGVMQQASDLSHGLWPAGVRVRAVFGLAPTSNWDNELVTKVPMAVMWGTCDPVNTGGYFEWASGRNEVPIHKFTVRGANHNYFNTQWAPQSGQVSSADDATPGTKPGYCQSKDGLKQDQLQLGERDQRQVLLGYASAFFRRYLADQTGFDPFLSGREQPPTVPAVVNTQFRPPVA